MPIQISAQYMKIDPPHQGTLSWRTRSPREKIRKIVHLTRTGNQKVLDLSPLTPEVWRQWANLSLFWGSETASLELYTNQTVLYINIQQKLTRQNKGINQERREYGMWKTGKPIEKQDKRNPQNGVEGRVHLKAWYTAGLERIWSRQVQCLRLQVR